MAKKTTRNVLESVRVEDFVEYYLFPPISAGLHEKEQENQLNKTLNQVNKIVEKYTSKYLWHKDEFKLSLRTTCTNLLIDGESEYLPPHLHGITHFGDNIDDEWFIVYLVRLLTDQIPHLIARLHDADGEFLLIEAADHLPAWATPEAAPNRVYLLGGRVHLLAPAPGAAGPPPAGEALAALRAGAPPAPAALQAALDRRLAGFPRQIAASLHRATAFLPVGVAAILAHRPRLVAAAVGAFCARDALDLRACRAMRFFPPENRVSATVLLTRCMYAMLAGSRYAPDRRTGWNVPAGGSAQFKAHDLGVKIASGFEILVAQARPSLDVEQDRGWRAYLGSLEEKGYFRGLMEGSRDYNDLLNKAKGFYIHHRDSMQVAPAIGQEILELTRSLDYKVDELKLNESNLQPDDDDGWLQIGPEELDQMLEEKYGRKRTVFDRNSNAGELAGRIDTFLQHESEIEGVEHPAQDSESALPTRPPRAKRDANRISFDPNAFSCAVQNILNFAIPEDDSWNLESDSEMSDYGEEGGAEGARMKAYMAEMDSELAKTTIGESFERRVAQAGDGFDDIESFEPVDIDVNALKNILESYKSQLGEAGPSSNMLGPMGVHLEAAHRKNE